jgi:hypothetical protein
MALAGFRHRKTKTNQPVQGGTAPLHAVVTANPLKTFTNWQAVRRYRHFAPSPVIAFMRARVNVPPYRLPFFSILSIT